MAIVHCQSVGWLLDHLLFINQPGYQVCCAHEHHARAFFDAPSAAASSEKDPVVAATPVTTNPCRTVSELAEKKSGEILQKTYLFREEFFNVFKPHIAADFPKELEQWSSETGLEDRGSEQQAGAESGNSHSEAAKKVHYGEGAMFLLSTFSIPEFRIVTEREILLPGMFLQITSGNHWLLYATKVYLCF